MKHDSTSNDSHEAHDEQPIDQPVDTNHESATAKPTAQVDSLSQAHPADESEEVGSQLEEITQDLKRVQAEFLNYKRRAEIERGEATDFAKTRVVREFLAVRDSFDQELLHRPDDVDAKWASSIDSIRAQFDKALKNLGVERFESVGQAFDPHRHEAIATDDGTGKHEVVSDELQAGYQLGTTVLRHAMVKVEHRDEPGAS